jgi:hypothetical protein
VDRGRWASGGTKGSSCVMASSSVAKPNGSAEVRQPDEPREAPSENRTLPEIPLAMAKAGIGLAIKNAIGDQPLKVYGDDSRMAKVISGEGVPDYLARIYRNPDARRRYALSLLRGDPNVRIRTTVDWDEEKAG